MRFSEAWLREYVNPDINTDTLTHQLTMAGLEVDSVEPAAPEFQGVVVGEVTAIQPHPDADRLSICHVNIGSGEDLQIVCGANNVRVTMRIPTALVGAVLPGNFKIKQSKLRGILSSGMLCSEQELGLADSADGLMELPPDAEIGVNIRNYLSLDDMLIEVDLTPNRADCLSIEGIAREVSVLNKIDVKTFPPEPLPTSHGDVIPVTLEAPEACPCYLGRLIRDVNVNADTPLWMQERLRRSGHRSLGPLVDVTNYILVELGQPMHAFDAAKIQERIVVRYARGDEKLTLLNDDEVTLRSDTLVIADQDSCLALAGIMGGHSSAVSDTTVDIFLECAFFTPAAIMGKARTYGLHTDSSHRFERGVDPEIQRRAIERATKLIVAIAGGEIGPISEQIAQQYLPQRDEIELRAERVRKLLGVSTHNDEIEDILRRLGMQIRPNANGWGVTAPSYRFDIAIEVDLIEEIGRVVGYDNLPLSSLLMHTELMRNSEAVLDLDSVKDLLVARDYHEAITYSFVDPDIQKKVNPDHHAIGLQNPISPELSVMRTSLWSGLIGAAQYNFNRQQNRIRLFESGLKFGNSDSGIDQQKSLAGLISGGAAGEQWGQAGRAVDFYDVKSDVQAILNLSGGQFTFSPGKHPALHPWQCAEIKSECGVHVGWLGMMHPSLENELGFNASVFLYELDMQHALQKSIPAFDQLSRFPSVRRDLAIVVDVDVPASQLVDTIKNTDDTRVKDVNIFDVYQGPGVESGRKSVALGLILQDSSRTLKENEIDAIVSGVLKKLADEFSAKLRD